MNKSDLPRAPGIYLLTHNVTGDTYVGSAANIHGRFRAHMADLRRGRHINRKMSAVALEHGVDFTCAVLRLTGDRKRYVHERASIKKLRPTLNKVMPPSNERGTFRGPFVDTSTCLPAELAKRIRRFCERHPFKPSMTRFAEIAFTDYLEQNEPLLPDQHHKGAK